MGRIWPWREEAAGEFWAEARKLLQAGGVIAVPTDTFYALAANLFQEAALSRVFALKQRAPEKPVLVLVDGPAMLKQLAREVPNPARRLMEKFWPGPLTIVFPGLAHLPRLLTAGTGWDFPSPAPAPIAPGGRRSRELMRWIGSSALRWT